MRYYPVCLPCVHEPVVTSIGQGQGIESIVFGAHSIVPSSACGAVIPGKYNHGPTIMEAQGQQEGVAADPLHHSHHFWFSTLTLSSVPLLS